MYLVKIVSVVFHVVQFVDDYNRVQLSSPGGEAGSDYINASFIEVSGASF